MRPAGEIRQALEHAAQDLYQAQGGATWRQMAAAAQVGWDAAQRTVENMARAGVLERIGSTSAPRTNRPMAVYAPKRARGFVNATTGGLSPLHDALRTWPRRT